MNVLVACEFTGIVRDAFIDAGHNAVSCDVRETETQGPHYKGDVMDIIDEPWDLMIAHPPCTYLANSGVTWLYRKDERWQDLIDGAAFFRELLTADIPQIAVENPVMHKWARKIIGRGPDFSIQPWQFGHEKSKRTCFWTKNLPDLEPTNIVNEGEKVTANSGKTMAKWYHESVKLPEEERKKLRSKTFPGIAQAMAEQWGNKQ